MRRFYVPPGEVLADEIFLIGGEAHHAIRVLRVRVGESVAVLDGVGHEWICQVCAVEKNRVQLKVLQAASSSPSACQITLFQAVPKGQMFESIVEKATELGVSAIVPVLSERVALKVDAKSAPAKAGKWRQTAIEAIKQCGQRWLPQIEEPQSLSGAVALACGKTFDLAVVGSLQSDARHPREYFAARSRPLARVGVWIGPEGDFTSAELAAIRATGAQPITLGRLVLRCETAAIYALSIVNYETCETH